MRPSSSMNTIENSPMFMGEATIFSHCSGKKLYRPGIKVLIAAARVKKIVKIALSSISLFCMDVKPLDMI